MSTPLAVSGKGKKTPHHTSSSDTTRFTLIAYPGPRKYPAFLNCYPCRTNPPTLITPGWKNAICPQTILTNTKQARHPLYNLVTYFETFRFRHVNATGATILASKLREDVVVEYKTSSGARRLAIAIKPDGKRNWIMNDAQGSQVSVPTKQVVYVVGDSETISEVNAHGGLERLETNCRAKAEENRELLQLVWETIIKEGGINGGKMTNVEAVADIIFGEMDSKTLYTTYLLLTDDLLFFKARNIKGQILFEARTEKQVEEVQLALQAQRERELNAESRKSAYVNAYQHGSISPLHESLSDNDIDGLINGLKMIAVELESGNKADILASEAYKKLSQNDKNLVSEALTAVGMKIKAYAAMDLLVKWGVFSRHENLALVCADIPHLSEFGSACFECVHEMTRNVPPDLDANRRRDLSEFPCYAIDSANTTEVDDAVSLDQDTGRIFVHVADPTRFFPQGLSNPVLEAAFKRTSTLYLPDRKYTMFPAELANSLFSLDGIESSNCALTFSFELHEDGSLKEESVQVEATYISCPLRLTYEEVERILASPAKGIHEKNLHLLYEKASVRNAWREIEGGAIFVKSSLSEVTVSGDSENPKLEVKVVDTTSKSWILVSELMITACAVAAEVAEKANLVVAFRTQEPFDYPDDDIIETVPDGPVRAGMIFRNATPSVLSTDPAEHATLGLDSYLQVTSPIRRSTDLIAHFQLKAHLRGSNYLFSEESVKAEIGRTNDLMRTLRFVENRSRKYWQFEYLRRRGPDVYHLVQYIRPLRDGDTRRGFVHFENVGCQAVASVPTDSRPGTMLSAKVSDVNPRTGMCRIEAFHVIVEEDREKYMEILDESFSSLPSHADVE